MEGIWELHWQRREYGQLTCQLFERCENGQLRLVDSWEEAPFGPSDVAAWLTRALNRERVTLTR